MLGPFGGWLSGGVIVSKGVEFRPRDLESIAGIQSVCYSKEIESKYDL